MCVKFINLYVYFLSVPRNVRFTIVRLLLIPYLSSLVFSLVRVMIIGRATAPAITSWAWSEDTPGSRCGPEDGPWPRQYQVLSEKDVCRELKELAKPQSLIFDQEKGYRADSINFQPSPKTRTQDRYVVTEINIRGQTWNLTGVFDGTSNYTILYS